MRRLLLAPLLLAGPAALAQSGDSVQDPQTGQGLPEAVSGQVAVVRALDKITAEITELEVPVNQPVEFGTLTIRSRYCYSRPPEEPPETFVFLEVDDQPPGAEEQARIFSGWMVASSPALNPLEHPVYDVWVLSCKMASAESASSSE